MKKIFLMMMIAIAASAAAVAQTKTANGANSSVESRIVALEKQSWEAWKNKDTAFFQTTLAEDALSVHGDGVENKSQIVKGIGSDCDVKSYSVDNFKFVMLNQNAALLTYTGMQDAVCKGQAIPTSVRASSVYAKHGGKWLNVFYMETPMTK